MVSLKGLLPTSGSSSKSSFGQAVSDEEFSNINIATQKKKTLKKFGEEASFFDPTSFEGKSKSLIEDFQKTTGKKYDFLGDTAGEFDAFMQQKHGITAEEHRGATTTALERGLTNTFSMAAGGIRNIARAGSGIGEKIGTAVGETDFGQKLRGSEFGQKAKPFAEQTKNFLPKGGETLSEDFLNLGEGVSDLALSVGMPVATTAFNVAGETEGLVGKGVRGFGEVLQKGGEYANKVPGLSHFRDSLNDNNKQRFDMFIGGGLFGLISSAKIRTKKGKLSFKALKDTDVIEAFLDIDRGQVPQGTVMGEAFNLAGKGVSKATNFLQKKTQTILSKKSPRFDETPEFQQKQVELQGERAVFDASEKLRQDEIVSKKRLQDEIKIKENEPKAKVEIENYNKQNPSHKFFDSIKDKLERKVTKNIDGGDYVSLKDGTFGEIYKTSSGEYRINSPKFLSKSKIERSTKTIKNSDIVSSFKNKKVSDSTIFDMMKKQDIIKQDDLDIDFIDEFVFDKKAGVLKNSELKQKIYADLKKEFSNKNSQELYTDIQNISKQKENTTSADLKNSLQEKIDFAKKLVHSKKAIEDYKSNLGAFDLIDIVRKGENTVGEALSILKDNVKSTFGTIFSGNTIKGTLAQINNISPEMGGRLRRSSVQYYNNILNTIPKFDNLHNKQTNLKGKELLDRKIDIYEKADSGVDMLNGEQRKVMDDVRNTSLEYGFDYGYKKDYIPRQVSDYKGLTEFFSKKPQEFPGVEALIQVKEMELGRKLTKKEKGDLITEVLFNEKYAYNRDKSSTLSNAEKRSIKDITPDLGKFYHNPYDAIEIYLKNSFETFQLLETLGYKKVIEPSKTPTKGEPTTKVGKSILSRVDDQIMSGKISPEDGKKLESLLIARFTEPSPRNKFEENVLNYKNILNIMNIANPISALTNLKDFGMSVYNFGALNTLGSIGRSLSPKLGKYFDKYIRLEDLGIDQLSLEFQTQGGLAKFTNKVMEISGFAKMDRVGKEVAINASVSNRKDWATKGESRYSKNIEGRDKLKTLEDLGMTKTEISQFKKDIQNDKLSDDVKMTIFHDLSGIQPIDKNAIPSNYNKTITGKLFYTYKTFLAKRLEFYQSEFFDVNRAKNPKEGAKRGARIIRFALTMTAVGMAVDEAKDMILGRSSAISDQAIWNLLELSGVMSKYSFFQFKQETSIGDWMRYNKQVESYKKRGKDYSNIKYSSDKNLLQNIRGYSKGVWSMVGIPATPITTIGDEVSAFMDAYSNEEQYNIFTDSYTVSRIPVLGKVFYRNFGAGAKKTVRDEAVRTKTPGFLNRTIREIIDPNTNLEGEKMFYAKVANVVDGDTLDITPNLWEKFSMTPYTLLVQGKLHPAIRSDGTIRIRQQGIDTPESVKAGHHVEYLGKAASNFAKESLIGKTVMVKSDYMGDAFDKYSRFLGVVNTLPETAGLLYKIPYLRNAQTYDDFHLQMIELGYAKPLSTFSFSEKELYEKVGQMARDENLGVWDKDQKKKYDIDHGITEEMKEKEKDYQYKKN